MLCEPSPAPRLHGRPKDLRSLQTFLVGLVERARAVGVASYEEAGSVQLLDELVPQVAVILLEALDALDCLLARYDSDGEGEREPAEDGQPDFFRRIDHLMVRRHSAECVADLSFMARGELRRMLGCLDSLSPAVDSWQIVAMCGSSLGKLARSVTAVEAAFCDHEGCEAMLVYGSELRHALEVRHAYGMFRRDLRICSKRNVLTGCLEGGAASIAKLAGREVYAGLRISDRVHLRALQERIISWHRAPVRDLPAGLRLWQDLWSFAHLLLDVSKRQELVEHDRSVLAELHLRLENGGEIGPEVRRLLDSLFGRDEELDLCLLGGEPLDVRSLEGPLSRLRSQRAPASAEPPAHVPGPLGFVPREVAPNR
jgi:hypothetical protein